VGAHRECHPTRFGVPPNTVVLSTFPLSMAGEPRSAREIARGSRAKEETGGERVMASRAWDLFENHQSSVLLRCQIPSLIPPVTVYSV